MLTDNHLLSTWMDVAYTVCMRKLEKFVLLLERSEEASRMAMAGREDLVPIPCTSLRTNSTS